MEIKLRDDYDSSWIDRILILYNKTELKRSDAQKVDRAFQKSFAVASCWIGENLVGIGRMISDGEMYASIFDVVIDPDHQKKGIGKLIMESLISKAPDTRIHLTSTFGNEEFYFKLGFKPHKTAMAHYPALMQANPYLDHDWKP